MSANKSESIMKPMQVEHCDDEITNDSTRYHVKCFGCCCDFRKAVIIINGIALGFQLYSLMWLVFAPSGFEAYKEYPSFLMIYWEVSIFIYCIIFSVGIYGALKFNRCAVITTSIFFAFWLLLSIIYFNTEYPIWSLVAVVMYALILYPHVCFLVLVDKGIMTPENYYGRVENFDNGTAEADATTI